MYSVKNSNVQIQNRIIGKKKKTIKYLIYIKYLNHT